MTQAVDSDPKETSRTFKRSTKPLSRRDARVSAISICYEASMKNVLPIDIARVIGLDSLDAMTVSLVQGVSDEFDAINEMISSHSIRWETTRLPVVELCILQCAIFELLGGDNTVGTVINEAVELTKHLALPESTNYINGILSAISKEYLK